MTDVICPHCQTPRWEFVATDPAVHYVPETDKVVQCRNGGYLRARVFLTNTESQILSDVSSEYVNCKLSISECDATGDVIRDANGAHVIFDAEVVSIRLKALRIGQDGRVLVGFDGALGHYLAGLLDRAEDTVTVRKQVLARFAAAQ